MFPLKNTEAYIHANGYRSTLGKELAARDAEINELGSEIQALTNYVTKNNVKNFLPTPYYSGTLTDGGVTFTPNADGSITVSGTASAANINYFMIRYNVASPLKKGTYTFSVEGLGNGDSANNLRVLFGGGDSGLTSKYLVKDSDSVTFEITEDYKTVGWCLVQTADTGATSATLKPMIRDASITDPTYQPYAKTNVELTQDSTINGITITLSNDNFATTSGTLQSGSVKLVAVGNQLVNIEYMDIRLSSVDENTNPTITITDDKLLAVSAFNETIPPTLRGADQSPVISNGGYCSHANNTNTMTIGFFNYIGTKPAGFLQILK